MYNDPGADQPVSALENANGFHIELNENALELQILLEPISKSPEEDNEAGELNEAQEILGMVLPADEDSALPLDPGEEALNEPTDAYSGLGGVDIGNVLLRKMTPDPVPLLIRELNHPIFIADRFRSAILR